MTKFQKLMLLTGSLLVSLLFGEIFLRFEKYPRPRDGRYLFWSIPFMQVGLQGTVTLTPNAIIREVAIYGDKVAYDIFYRTNNLGAVDQIDYPIPIIHPVEGFRKIIIVGDSFTAGSGGFSWPPEIRKYISNGFVYGFGLPGGGFKHFEKILNNMNDVLGFNEIVVVAISNDFNRPYFYPREDSGKIYFCTDNDSCVKAKPIARQIALNEPSSEIVARAKTLQYESEREFESTSRPSLRLIKTVLRRFYLYQVTANLFHGPPKQKMDLKSSVGIQTLERIRGEFPNLKLVLIHLPQRTEVKNHTYEIELKDEMQRIGISYFPALERCRWSSEMYYEEDGHPNTDGYANISDCVGKYLETPPE